jgi:EF hand domain-containing protein
MVLQHIRLVLGAFGGLALLVAGCSRGPSRIEAPKIDASAAGSAAIDAYDTNHDGVISGAELVKCPALKFALSRYDTNGDGKVTAANIAARIQVWQETHTARTQLTVVLKFNGSPLAGATVTLEPEKFLGPNVLPATGVTNAAGGANPVISQDESGVNLGLYKVRVSKMVNGKELIPARYNAETELGLEVAQDAHELDSGVEFKLTSK